MAKDIRVFMVCAILVMTLLALYYNVALAKHSLYPESDMVTLLMPGKASAVQEERNLGHSISEPIDTNKVRSKKTVIISGAHTDYFQGLLNMIGSIHFWEPDRKIAVYNLGLNSDQLEELSHLCKVTVHWPTGFPSYFPKHITTERLKEYAWKPLAIKDAVDRYEKIFWMDAGSDVRSPLDLLDEDLERDGFFFIEDCYKRKVTFLLHQGMVNYFNLSMNNFIEKVVFVGGYQGYVKNSDGYFKILKPLVACANDEKCICPRGSSLKNHRYDQSALSLIIHTSGIDMDQRSHFRQEHPRRDFFQKDHTVPSNTLIYSARRKSDEYIKYLKRSNSGSDCAKR